jgi:TolB-like protein
MAAESTLELYLLGTPRVKQAGQSLNLSRKKAAALLAYLAVTRRQFNRDTLATLLWPEHDDSHARGSLRRMLFEVKKQLGGEYLSIEGDLIGLSSSESVWVDVSEFERHIAKSRAHRHEDEANCNECLTSLSSAESLYQDHFMMGFTLGRCSEFTDWQFFQGEYLRRELSAALERLTAICLTTESHTEGIRYARRWATVDPLSEEAHRGLMKLYALDGQQAAALRQYQLCRDQLEKELSVAPEEATEELYTSVKQRRFAAAKATLKTQREPRLAVLPFKSLAKKEGEDWFADGMTDALITALSQNTELGVISFTSCLGYKETAKSLQQIAAELRVDHVLEGAVLNVGKEVRISVQLIEAATDRHIWAESLQSPFKDILSLQSRIAKTITEKIEKQLTPQRAAAKSRPVDPRAYEAVMTEDFYLRTGGGQNRSRAADCYMEGLRIDHGYAPAHAGLAEAYTALWGYGGTEELPHGVARRKALAAVRRALDIDPDLVRARMVLGIVKWRFDWDARGAMNEYLKVLEINPNHAPTLARIAGIETFRGRFEEAIELFERANRLDPLNPLITHNLSLSYTLAGYYRKALIILERNEELFPQIEQIYCTKMGVYILTDRSKLAAEEAEKINLTKLEVPMVLGYLGLFYSWLGIHRKARQILERMFSLRQEGRNIPSVYIALVHNGLGQTEEALECLERAFTEHESYLPVICHFPEWEDLRTDSRCQELISRIGIDD